MNFVKLPIVEVLEQYIDLNAFNEDGSPYYTAICPFHDDSSPSLVVYPNDDSNDSVWMCLACSDKWGDVIDFVKQIENIGFKEALKKCTQSVRSEDIFLRELQKKKSHTLDDYLLYSIRGYTLLQKVGLETALTVFEEMDGYLAKNNFYLANKLLMKYNV